MRLRALLLTPVLVLGSAVAVACNGSEQPDVAGLIGSSLRAASQQDDLKVHYSVNATIEATPSAQASAQTRRFLSEPVSLTASGGLSKEAVTLVGNLAFAGKSFDAEARIGERETYVNLLGSWYGDTTKGLDDAQGAVSEQTDAKASPEELKKTLRWVYDHSDEVLDATVTQGPDIDGDTWQAKGHCKPAAVVELAQRNGKTVTPQEYKGIEQFCRVTELTYVIGADDNLPRQIHIAADLDKQTLAELAAADQELSELDGLRLALDIKLTKWGEDVEYTAPADPKPMEDLGMAVLGLLFQVAG
jgi:hypothetical protein